MQLLEACVRNLHDGNMDALVAQRGKLREALGARWPEEDLLRLKACCAQVHLLLVDRKGTAESLKPFVTVDARGRVDVRDTGIRKLERLRSFGAGAVLAQVANALYRGRTFDVGVDIAERADAILRSCRDAPEQDHLLTMLENRVWWSRLLWHQGKRARAESRLEETLNRLAQESVRFEQQGGVDLITAIGLNLWASFDWIRGRVQDARRRIYRALFLLGGVHDQVRLAHSLFVAGRVEATHSTTGFQVAIGLLRQAQRCFESGQRPHPFLARALIQEAQCQIKAGLVEEAEATLKRVDMLKLDDAVEQMVAKADRLLSQAWILEREAREDASLWKECLQVTRELHRMAEKSERLELEGRLHYGRALVQQAGHSDLKKGQRLIREVLREAGASGRRKIEVAAILALSESYILQDQLARGGATSGARSRALRTAVSYWRQGARELDNLESTYLREWLEEIDVSLEKAVTIKISARQPLKEAIETLKREYVRYHQRRGRSGQEMAEAMGVAQSTMYDLKKRYGSQPDP